MTTSDLGSRFMAAFNDIEGHLRSSLGRRGNARFTDMAQEYAETEHLPQEHLEALRAFASLRNAISHQRYYGGFPIAEPVPGIVEQIELLRDHIMVPPHALNVLGAMAVCTTCPDEPISSLLDSVRRYDYSQLPVYDQGRYIGILTTNAIARWLADQLARNVRLGQDERVGRVLAFAEPHERAILVPRTLAAADAIYRLSQGGHDGGQVTALIITDQGVATETPLAVVVGWDLPKLSAAVSIR